MVFDHVAENEGTIVLRVAPIEGTPIDVEIRVPERPPKMVSLTW